jgi:hypothetical protein
MYRRFIVSIGVLVCSKCIHWLLFFELDVTTVSFSGNVDCRSLSLTCTDSLSGRRSNLSVYFWYWPRLAIGSSCYGVSCLKQSYNVILNTVIAVMVDFYVMKVNDSCGFMVIDHTSMTTIFVYSTSQRQCPTPSLTPCTAMGYDLLALALTIIGLRNTPSSNVMWKILRKQGITYVLITCLANIVPTVRTFEQNSRSI